ncbi:c-type cytochrome [Sorangium sp. So ce1078]|uniref:c-type cytochrome n=1 Tax=Sorangium sp. So ce1078 TaxID=3133329 RepID=UPI003F5E33A7
MKHLPSLCLASLLLAGCVVGEIGEELATDQATNDWDTLPPVSAPDPELWALPTREAQYRAFCASPRGDSFFRAVCATPRPSITDLASLLRVAKLDENRAFALTGNSTSLVKRAVSAINPRIIIFPRVTEMREKPAEMTALGFVRGEPFVEIVSRDLSSGDYNFYLFTFERQCDYDGSCDLAGLITEEIEHDWTAFSIYTEEDVENTSFDCRSCHQPDGYGTKKILRMQELEFPWTHWFPQRFVQRTDSDRVLTAQFLEAHARDAQYGGIPIATIQNAIDEGSGAQLEALLVAEGQAAQPNAFDPRIEAEIKVGSSSPTWEKQFAVSLAGDSIPVPYPLVDVTDPALRAERTRSYLDVVTGAAPRQSLLDSRDLFSADARVKLGLVPPPGASGRAVLTQLCSRCHDGRVNPALSRANFNVKNLDGMSRGMKDAAILRLQEPATSPLRMPPWRAADPLSPAELAAAIEELRK